VNKSELEDLEAKGPEAVLLEIAHGANKGTGYLLRGQIRGQATY
jgi:hypothetical protein